MAKIDTTMKILKKKSLSNLTAVYLSKAQTIENNINYT